MSVEIRIVLEIPATVQAIERMHVIVGREVHGLHISFTFNYYFVQLYKEIMIFVFSRIVLSKCLISVALNRRHLTEGQKAVLANNYSTILSKKRESEAGKKANEVRWHSNDSSDETTVSSSDKDEVDRSRKVASNKFKFSEWKVRIVQQIGNMVKSPYRTMWPTRTTHCPPTIMTNKDPQSIQKIYPVIEFSEVSYSKGKWDVY